MASVDGFTEVKRRGRKRHTHTQSSRAPAATERELKENEYSGPETRLLMLKTETVRQQLKETQFYNELINVMEQSCFVFSTIVCYGIGHIGTCHIALGQFALLLEMAELYKPHTTWLYDPALHTQELAAIEECGCQIVSRNEHCKHRADKNTLFFMPHCGKAMYNNLLWANWSREQLARIAIIGNSFNTYHEKWARYQCIQGACREIPLPVSYPDSTVFNDTSVHLFPLNLTLSLDQQVWRDCPEPTLDPSDPEMIA